MTSRTKRILLLSLNFSPELIGIGKYTGDLAEKLSEYGFDLHVVTAPPYYPDWKVKEGYSNWLYHRERAGNMIIDRCPLWVPRRPSNLNRLPHLLSFALSSFPVMLAQIRWQPDIVLCVIPTLFSAPVAWVVARLSGAKCWLHIQDFELEAAFSLGMLPIGKLFLAISRFIESLVITRFDRVSTISENMVVLATQKGVAPHRTYLLPNWVDTRQIFPMQVDNELRRELAIEKTQKVILYHGNLGRKQGLEILVEAATLLQVHPDIIFVICGDGAARVELEQRTRELKNVLLLGLQPASRLNELVNLADLHVLPQRADVADLVMPSKLTTMLASGKPVIACASPGTQLWKLMNQVGKVVPPGDAQVLSEAILALMSNPEERDRLAKLGRNYTCQFLEKEVILVQFGRVLQE